MVVDTGATYTVLPETLWRDLGIVPTRTVRAKLVNGEFVYRDLGDADQRKNKRCDGRNARAHLQLLQADALRVTDLLA